MNIVVVEYSHRKQIKIVILNPNSPRSLIFTQNIRNSLQMNESSFYSKRRTVGFVFEFYLAANYVLVHDTI